MSELESSEVEDAVKSNVESKQTKEESINIPAKTVSIFDQNDICSCKYLFYISHLEIISKNTLKKGAQLLFSLLRTTP